jgi:hypothetical protein
MERKIAKNILEIAFLEIFLLSRFLEGVSRNDVMDFLNTVFYQIMLTSNNNQSFICF